MTDIGKRIKEIRLKKGLSQEELAESSKVNLRTIQRIENNETKPRDKTLKLIFNALDIEVIQQEQKPLNKDFIWSSFLTLLIIIGSIIGWFEFISSAGLDFEKTGPKLITTNGWKGNININVIGFNFYNWLVSICALSIGSVSISNSLGLIEKKKRYILGQLIFILLYLVILGVLSEQLTNESKYLNFKPGLFIVITATALLTINYLKKK